MIRYRASLFALALGIVGAVGCQRDETDSVPRATGYVEATEVRVTSKVPGRVTEVKVAEGARVEKGETLVVLAPTNLDLALDRSRAERGQADAQLRLLRAGARAEEVQLAEAQVAAAESDRRAADAELSAAHADESRFQQLLDRRAGAQKQRDDAASRREMAEARLKAAADRVAAATATLARVRAGARPEEIAAATARVAAVDAQIAALEHDRGETTVVAPSPGIVTSRLVEPGELAAAGVPLLVIVDLEQAWVNAYVDEPLVPSLRINQPATIVTDGQHRLKGRIAFIAPRAEFTPRNVQTATERAKLVYRVKVTTDNHDGVLKPGMPVDVELEPAR